MKASLELLEQAAALTVKLETAIEAVEAPNSLSRSKASELAVYARRLNCILCELECVMLGKPSPVQTRD